MYVVEVRNKTETVVIHDDRIPNNQAILGSESKVSASVGAAASFTFTIYPNNPGYNKLLEWVSYIDVINTQKNKYLFRGRVITIQPHATSEGTFYKEVTCESQLAYLNDSIVTWQKVQMRPADFFKQLITSHNAQVDQERQFKFGRATVTNNTDNVYCYVEDGLKTLNELQTDLLTKEDLGGELWIRDEKDGTYIDWIRDEKKKADQEIKLAKNLISIQSKPELTGLVTVLYPFGASEEKSVSDENVHDVSTPRINISSVNNGKKYIEDPELISMYGRIAGSKNWDDVKIPSNLLSKAREYLNSFKALKIAYEIEAVDLAPLNLAVDDFQLGKYYHVINPVIGVDDWLRVVGVSININKPLLSTLQIGDQTKRLVDYQLNNTNMTRAISSLRRSQQENLTQISQLQQENQTLARNYRNLQQALQELENKFNEQKPQPPQPQPMHIGKIIDVSEWQGVIDWNSVIKDDVTLSIIRVQDGSSHQDLKYMENLQKCINAGGKYAVYAYFRGTSTSDAQQEARDFFERTQRVVANKQQPVFYAIDVESVEMGGNMSQMRAGIEAFMSQLNTLGVPDHKIVLYIANHLYDSFNLNTARAGAIWIPSYGQNDGSIVNSTKPTHPYDLWQYTSKGRVSGITGNVDMNTEPSEKFKTYLS